MIKKKIKIKNKKNEEIDISKPVLGWFIIICLYLLLLGFSKCGG